MKRFEKVWRFYETSYGVGVDVYSRSLRTGKLTYKGSSGCAWADAHTLLGHVRNW